MKLIISPLKIEMKFLMASLEELGLRIEKIQDQGRWFWICSEKQWILYIGGHGKTQFALQTQYAIQFHKNIERIFCVGAAGGLNPQLKVGQLFWVSDIIEHDYKILFSEKKLPEFKTDPSLFNNLSHDHDFYTGVLASGDEDIISAQRADELIKTTGASAVAWESAGGIRAAQFNKIPYNELRVITDNARDNVANSFNNSIEGGMTSVAKFLFENF